jgi:hypothetical protein
VSIFLSVEGRGIHPLRVPFELRWSNVSFLVEVNVCQKNMRLLVLFILAAIAPLATTFVTSTACCAMVHGLWDGALSARRGALQRTAALSLAAKLSDEAERARVLRNPPLGWATSVAWG